MHDSLLTGILINGPGPGPYLTGVTVDSTLRFAGIELNGVQGAFLTNLTVTGSATYGVWLVGSSRNVIANFSVSRNTDAGIYLGCFRSGGILGKACTTVPPTLPSNGNILTSVGDPSTADGPSQPEQAYGVAIAAGNVGNRIVGVEGSGNGNGTFGVDALDGNLNCGTKSLDREPVRGREPARLHPLVTESFECSSQMNFFYPSSVGRSVFRMSLGVVSRYRVVDLTNIAVLSRAASPCAS